MRWRAEPCAARIRAEALKLVDAGAVLLTQPERAVEIACDEASHGRHDAHCWRVPAATARRRHAGSCARRLRGGSSRCPFRASSRRYQPSLRLTNRVVFARYRCAETLPARHAERLQRSRRGRDPGCSARYAATSSWDICPAGTPRAGLLWPRAGGRVRRVAHRVRRAAHQGSSGARRSRRSRHAMLCHDAARTIRQNKPPGSKNTTALDTSYAISHACQEHASATYHVGGKAALRTSADRPYPP